MLVFFCGILYPNEVKETNLHKTIQNSGSQHVGHDHLGSKDPFTAVT